MSKYVMVHTVSMFNMKYCLEVPDDVPPEKLFDYAEKQVSDENVKEFSQRHMGESVANYDVVTPQEICDQFRADQSYLSEWSDEQIMKSVTPIGFDINEYYEEEERQWRLNTN